MSLIDLQTRANLSTIYTEPHRHYHNLNHIHHCLRELDECEELLSKHEHQQAIELFIWFHDIVYDPKSTLNEAKSAEVFEKWFGGYWQHPLYKGEIFSLAHTGILSTISHWNRDNIDIIDYMLDIDLSILGASSNDYLDYRNNIRKEYSFVDFNQYAIKRIEVLNKILSKNKIYKTDIFNKKYEKKARYNLEKEILYLKGFNK